MQQDSSTTLVTSKPLAKPLTQAERLVLTVLALRETTSITQLSMVVQSLEGDAAREASGPAALRKILKRFIEAAWVFETTAGYRLDPSIGPGLLRAHGRDELTAFGQRYIASLQRGFGLTPTASQLDAQVMLGLAGADFDWEASLSRLLSFASRFQVIEHLLRAPLLAAFDVGWFNGFSESQRRLLVGLVLDWCEATSHPLAALEAYAAEPSGVVQRDVELRARWARLQLLRGGAPALSREIVSQLPLATGVAFSWHMVAGDFAGARRVLDTTFDGKRQTVLPGLAGVLQVLALMRGDGSSDWENAARLAGSGARKGNAFRETFGVLKRVLACQMSGGRQWDVIRSRGDDTDKLFELVGALSVLWFQELAQDLPFVLLDAHEAVKQLRSRGTSWLAEQYRDACSELARRLPMETLARLRKAWGSQVMTLEAALRAAEDAAPLAFPPLRALLASKPAWEAAVVRLEALAQQTASAAETASAERLLWRVSRYEIEPYLQKRTASGWSRGRKLAIKHLMPGSAERAKLPPEDARVAEHARESVSASFGYREVSYSFGPGAWQALVGHPRVYWQDAEAPIEVVLGTLRLVAKEDGEQFSLTVEPDGLSEGHHVRLEGEHLVVYPTDKAALRVLEVVGRGLTVPLAQRERLLGAAAGITHLIPLHSSAPGAAPARPGDPTPCLRLSPRGSGLAVALRVRPLGERGPALTPGAGSPLVFAPLEGTPAQASRDLELEAALAGKAVAACAVLEGRETGSHDFLLDTPEACLELLASLATLGEQVRVEWPHGRPITLRARLGRDSLRGRLRRVGADFFLDASVVLDQDQELPLAELLRIYVGQTRFVRLEQGDFVELSAELREQLSAIAAARRETPGAAAPEVALPPTAIAALEGLMASRSSVVLDAPAVKWQREFARVFDSKPRIPRGLNAELRDYQVDGFRWLARLGELGFGACLADDMGLGKTVQLIALLLHRARTGPALVVAPTSVCDNWRRELLRFAPSLSVESYAGAEREALLEGLQARDVLVTGYATLQQDAEALQAIAWGTVILDESQFIKNAGAQRTRAALGLRAAMRVAATGTPVENRAEDLYSLFQFIQPGLLGTAASFRRRFPLSEETPAGRESRRHLRKLIQPFLLRRTKAQVLAELPPVTEIEHQVELSREEALLYEAVRRAALDKIGVDADRGEGNKIVMLAELTRLRRLCCDARLVVPDAKTESSKLKAFLELMRELSQAGHRALVFSQFVDVLKLAQQALESAGMTYQYLDGSCTPKQRSAAVDAFQAGSGDAFLISLKAGGFGLNLTAADYVIHLDPWWNPAAEAQATDRAHRIGQQNPVTVYRLVAQGTIEERIVALHRSKRDLADSLLAESDQAAALSSAELRALLEP